jgi:hypothetical protein
MNVADIETLLNTRLTGLGLGVPFAWPNLTYSGVKPYIAVQFVRVSTLSIDLAATRETHIGLYSLTVVSATETGQTFSYAKAQAIKNGFPAGLRLNAASGELVITNPAEIKDGFRDGADWRLPVIIGFKTFN